MEPIELARWLKEGIENEQVIVTPYADGPQRLRAIYDKMIDYASPEGMKRIAEREKMAADNEPDDGRSVRASEELEKSGFGKAKAGIDWVDASKKKA